MYYVLYVCGTDAVIVTAFLNSVDKQFGNMVPLGPSPGHQTSVNNSSSAAASGTKNTIVVICIYTHLCMRI